MSVSQRLEPRATASVEVAKRVGNAAGAAARDVWVERIARFGYVVRGVIYATPGVLALKLALRDHGAAITQTGAIELIGRQPLGRLLLIVVAVGLAGYALWGVVRAVFDPLHKGHSPGGLAKRFGFLTSALAYGTLLVATLRLLSGGAPEGASRQDWSTALLAKPLGAWLVGGIGVCWIAGAGVGEIVRGWRASFREDLAFERMSPLERRVAVPLGRIGTIARGAVFTVIGILLVVAALNAAARHQGGMDGALLELARQPFGRALLAAAALGLMAFGAYSAMCARWMRMHAGARVEDSRPPHSRFTGGSS